jgi:hypothetical protein
MAQTNSEKQAALRLRRANLGLKRKEFWLTDDEYKELVQFLAELRREDISPRYSSKTLESQPDADN